MSVERALVEVEKLDGELDLQRWRRDELRKALLQAKHQNAEFADLESACPLTSMYTYLRVCTRRLVLACSSDRISDRILE